MATKPIAMKTGKSTGTKLASAKNGSPLKGQVAKASSGKAGPSKGSLSTVKKQNGGGIGGKGPGGLKA